MLQQLETYFFSAYHFRLQSLWFKRLLYVFLIFECCYYFAFFDLLFGPDSVVFVEPKSIGFFKDLAFLLYYSRSGTLSFCFLAAILLLSFWNLFFKHFRLAADVLIWFLVLNLHNRIYPALTGGNNLLNQLLLFNCFLSFGFDTKQETKNSWKICFHNLGAIAIVAQVCFVYLVSALAKLGDASWLSGSGVEEIAKIRHFSVFTALQLPESVFVLLNYFVLFYQLLFPALIWFRKIKKPLLLAGVAMHLYIAFVMGLMSFGFIMILAYLFFWPFKAAES